MTAQQKTSGRRTQRVPGPLTIAQHTVAHEGHPERNEDANLVDARRGLVAVFDGVGGSEGGDVASRLAARVVKRAWRKVAQHYQPHDASSLLTLPAACDLEDVLRTILHEAQEALRSEGERRARAAGEHDRTDIFPETTAVLAVFYRRPDQTGYMMGYAHVGDSRAYLLRRDGSLQRLTRDDGYFLLKVNDHTISEEDALRIDQATHEEQLNEMERQIFERRNGITQSLGHPTPKNPYPTVHTALIAVEAGERVLLCSDGIHDNLVDSEIATVLSGHARTTLARRLVQQAQQRSHEMCLRAKKDDMSAVVVTCH
jgi:PPM family protein phosphatase